MREHQRIEETYKEKLSRLIEEAGLDMETITKARNNVLVALLPKGEASEQRKKQNTKRANSLIGELFAGSFTDGEVSSAEVIRRLADPSLKYFGEPRSKYNVPVTEAEEMVRRRKSPKMPDTFFTTKGARTIRIVGKQYTELLFGQENEG